jgi:transposase
VHVRETLACPCGQHIVAAQGPERVGDRVQYGPGFIAFIVVAKCGDSIPIYRLEKSFRRLGIPVARSTMTDLFHRAAELLAPLVVRMLAFVRAAPVVRADETSITMLGTEKRAFMWAFLCDEPAPIITYRFSPSRSGDTPANVLGGSTGALVVDMYTGYNQITAPGGRTRAACLAHARRHLFAALATAPEVRHALDLIRDVYVVEHEAKRLGAHRRAPGHAPGALQTHHGGAQGLAHGATRGLPAEEPARLRDRLRPQQLDSADPLPRRREDPPPDNNASESALRVVALGRTNYLFVGNEDAGNNVAGLYSLVATCEAKGVNPLDYLSDVLLRVRDHPAAEIDDLLPTAGVHARPDPTSCAVRLPGGGPAARAGLLTASLQSCIVLQQGVPTKPSRSLLPPALPLREAAGARAQDCRGETTNALLDQLSPHRAPPRRLPAATRDR